jgi:hypothetical protein
LTHEERQVLPSGLAEEAYHRFLPVEIKGDWLVKMAYCANRERQQGTSAPSCNATCSVTARGIQIMLDRPMAVLFHQCVSVIRDMLGGLLHAMAAKHAEFSGGRKSLNRQCHAGHLAPCLCIVASPPSGSYQPPVEA